MTMERRNLQLEVRETNSADGNMQLKGVVNKPGEMSQLLYSKGRKFYEVVAKGVFDKAIKEAKEILFLDSHDRTKILASTKNDSLTLIETDNGVEMTADIVNTSYGRDAYELISSGLIGNMSFGFNCVKDSWERGKDGVLVRTLHDIKLSEVSCVKAPAYTDSSIDTRGIDIGEIDIPELEDEQRDNEPEAKEPENPNLFEFKNEAGERIGSIELRELNVDGNNDGADAELFIYDEIGNSKWEAWWGATVPHQIIAMVDKLRKCRNINLRINSPGGSVFGGYAIANLLKTVPGKKTAHVDGICASIATVIALACDEVVIPSNCIFMIHPPSSGCRGNAVDMRKTADLLDTIEEGLLDVYMQNAAEGVTRDKMKELVDAETYLSGAEAAKVFNITVKGVNTEARSICEVGDLEVTEFDLRALESVQEEPENIVGEEGASEGVEEEPKNEDENKEPEATIFDEDKLKAMLEDIKNKRGIK